MGKQLKVKWEKEGNIAVIIIDNPPANTLSHAVTVQLLSSLKEIESVEEIRCVVLTSAGEKFFMAGADLREYTGRDYFTPGFALDYLDAFKQPVIAAVQGLALGGGCELTLCCDLCIAAENACFGLPEVKLGMIPGGGGTQRLPRRVGEARAKELMFLGEQISAQEALKIGLVNRVVAEGTALAEAKKMAQRIAAQPAVSIRMIKQCVERGLEVPLAEGLKIEADLFELAYRTADAREGVAAFLEKRRPNFKHK